VKLFFLLIFSDYIFVLNRDYCYEKKDCYRVITYNSDRSTQPETSAPRGILE